MIYSDALDKETADNLQQVQKELRDSYELKYQFIRPLPLWQDYKFKMATMFTQLKVLSVRSEHLPVKRYV